MNKIFSVSTLAIISSLMLTGCGTKQEPIENKTDNNSINIEAGNADSNGSKVESTNTNNTDLKNQLVTSLDNITIINENSNATNDEKIKNLKQELDSLNKLNASAISDNNLKEGLELLTEGVSKQIEFLEGSNEYHKGNKSDDYKDKLVGLAYEATDLLLAAEIILK